MSPTSRYPYQTRVLLEADIGDWIEGMYENEGISRAHAMRLAITEGRRVLESMKPSELAEAINQEPYRAGRSRQKDSVNYPYQAMPRLSAADGAWVVEFAREHDVDKSTLLRTLLRLGHVIVDRRKRAADKIAA